MTALKWVSTKKANTKLVSTGRNDELFELIDRAEEWLKSNTYVNKLLKWETQIWGENLQTSDASNRKLMFLLSILLNLHYQSTFFLKQKARTAIQRIQKQ